MSNFLLAALFILAYFALDYFAISKILKRGIWKSMLMVVASNVGASCSMIILGMAIVAIDELWPFEPPSFLFLVYLLVFPLVKAGILFAFNKTEGWKKIGKVILFGTALPLVVFVVSTILLNNPYGSRPKAYDAAIKGSMETLRAVAEMQYDSVGNYSAVCPEDSGAFGDSELLTFPDGSDFAKISKAIRSYNNDQRIHCNESSDGQAYAAWTNLRTSGYFCVDSAGAAKTLKTQPLANSTICPQEHRQ